MEEPHLAHLPAALLLEVVARLSAPDVGSLIAAHPRLFAGLRAAVLRVQLPPPPEAQPGSTVVGSSGPPELKGHRQSTVVCIRRLACRRLFPALREVACHPAARVDGIAVLFGTFPDLPNCVSPPLSVSGSVMSIAHLVRPTPAAALAASATHSPIVVLSRQTGLGPRLMLLRRMLRCGTPRLETGRSGFPSRTRIRLSLASP